MSNISFDIPQDLANALAKLGPDISQTAKEALLIDLYRRRLVTLRVLREALGLERLEVEHVLARHDVSHDTNVDEFRSQAEALRRPNA
jgi:predicted HTH domain antitoxin